MHSTAPNVNVARRLREHARGQPDRTALAFPLRTKRRGEVVYGSKTFREVDEESDAYAHGLRSIGIARGTKTILMVKPGPELVSIVFALFKIGAVPVIVDPGMGIRRMLHCYESVGADAFIGIPIAHVVRRLYPSTFSSLQAIVTVSGRPFWGGHALSELAEKKGPYPIEQVGAGDLAVLNFTTGSTGPAKGVEYTHGMAEAMARRIELEYGQGPKDVSLASVPLFALFDLLIGSTSVLPPMDPTKPARVDPTTILSAIETFGVTTMFASPAFLHRVGGYAVARGRKLSSLRCLIAGGAPVSASIVANFRKTLDASARFATTYGATEALPIASIDDAEILGETYEQTRKGKGTCVGRPMADIDVRIVRITDDALPTWTDDLLVPPGEVGEIVIAGPTVSQRYHGAGDENRRLKIVEDGARRTIWHRTGDLGYVDDAGRLWFCGRKSQRVTTAAKTLFTVQCEGVFNAHPDVYRTALVGVGPRGRQTPVVCVELREPANRARRARIEVELREMASRRPLTRNAQTFLFHPSFPVDIRHNAKIGRETLAKWAAHRLGVADDRRARSKKSSLLRIVPIAGWLFILYGLVGPMPHRILWALWSIDVFLSVVVHGLQLFVSIPRGHNAGYSTAQTVFFTLLFGATWWKFLDEAPLEPLDTAESSVSGGA